MARRRLVTTAGGLRWQASQRGGADEAIDEQLEWDRDGQYFHYLTKWMHALCQAAFVTSSHEYSRWAGELAQTIVSDLLSAGPHPEAIGVYWKMNTDSRDRSFPHGTHVRWTVSVTFREVQHAIAKVLQPIPKRTG